MKKIWWLIPVLLVLFSAIIAYKWGSLPKVESKESKDFSAERVWEDLKVIAQKPHSVADSAERAEVREYLVERLRSLGGSPVVFHYPGITSRIFHFDAFNVYAEFPPLIPSNDTTYLLMVAHYDSCYPRKVRNQTETSLGAADDGYGLGVILECLQLSLKQRSEWHQGIKILFTDAEEVDLIGMKFAYANHRYLFDNVGLTVNLEARGTYGPVLLFETSPGNKKLIELYGKQAKYPYTYSLTNVVYQAMPNGTDFTIIKDSIPGFNFSTIADINHYHTSWDNIENTSLYTIQHYGSQIFPTIIHYLKGEEYADVNYFKQQDDLTYFTLPVLGFFSFTKSGYLIYNLVLSLLILLSLAYYISIRKFKCCLLLKTIGWSFLSSIIVLGLGLLISWLCCQYVGFKFSVFRTLGGMPYDNLIMAGTIAIIGLITTWICSKQQRHGNEYLFQLLYGVMILQLIFSTILLFTIGENIMFFIPLAATWIGLMGWRITSSKFFLGLSICFVSLHAFSFLYVLAMALSIGTFSIVLWLAFYDLLTIILLSMLFQKRSRSSVYF